MQRINLFVIFVLLLAQITLSLDVSATCGVDCPDSMNCASKKCYDLRLQTFRKIPRCLKSPPTCPFDKIHFDVAKCSKDLLGENCASGLCYRSRNFDKCATPTQGKCQKKSFALISCFKGKVVRDYGAFEATQMFQDGECPFDFGSIEQRECSGDSQGNPCSCCRTTRLYGDAFSLFGTDCVTGGTILSEKKIITQALNIIEKEVEDILAGN